MEQLTIIEKLFILETKLAERISRSDVVNKDGYEDNAMGRQPAPVIATSPRCNIWPKFTDRSEMSRSDDCLPYLDGVGACPPIGKDRRRSESQNAEKTLMENDAREKTRKETFGRCSPILACYDVSAKLSALEDDLKRLKLSKFVADELRSYRRRKEMHRCSKSRHRRQRGTSDGVDDECGKRERCAPHRRPRERIEPTRHYGAAEKNGTSALMDGARVKQADKVRRDVFSRSALDRNPTHVTPSLKRHRTEEICSVPAKRMERHFSDIFASTKCEAESGHRDNPIEVSDDDVASCRNSSPPLLLHPLKRETSPQIILSKSTSSTSNPTGTVNVLSMVSVHECVGLNANGDVVKNANGDVEKNANGDVEKNANGDVEKNANGDVEKKLTPLDVVRTSPRAIVRDKLTPDVSENINSISSDSLPDLAEIFSVDIKKDVTNVIKKEIFINDRISFNSSPYDQRGVQDYRNGSGDVIIVDSDDSILPDIPAVVEVACSTRRVSSPDCTVGEFASTQSRWSPRYSYSDCLKSTPNHGRYDVGRHRITSGAHRTFFTYDQVLSIEGCMEEAYDYKFLHHAVWWLQYASVEREPPRKLLRRVVRQVQQKSRDDELSFAVHHYLVGALERYPPRKALAFDGSYLGDLLGYLKCEVGHFALINYGLTLDYLVSSLQAEFFTRRLAASRDLKRSAVQLEFGTEDSKSHRELKYIIKKLKILPQLAHGVGVDQHLELVLTPRRLLAQVSRVLELLIITSDQPNRTASTIARHIAESSLRTMQSTCMKHIVMESLSSPLLRCKLIEIHQKWLTFSDLLNSCDEKMSTNSLHRACIYIESQIQVARGQLTQTLPHRLLKLDDADGRTLKLPPAVVDDISCRYPNFTADQLAQLTLTVNRSTASKPQLLPYLMRLEIAYEALY